MGPHHPRGRQRQQPRKPTGFYSDGTHIWVSDADHDRVFRYDFSSKSHNSSVNLALHSDNGKRQGLWSDGTTAWISDSDDDKLYAYTLSDFSRDSGKDIDLHSDNGEVRGIWSDGTIIWALDRDDEVIYAYTLSDGSREAGLDIALPSAGVNYNSIWSNGTTMYVIENAAGSTRNPRIHRLMIPGGTVSITSGGDVDEESDAVFTLTRFHTSGPLDVDVVVSETGGDMVAAERRDDAHGELRRRRGERGAAYRDRRRRPADSGLRGHRDHSARRRLRRRRERRGHGDGLRR